MAARGQELLAAAQKKFQGGGGFFGKLFSGPNYEEAADLYQQAANQFKLAKDWPQAAQCLLEAALCAQKLGSKSDEATQLTEAANCLKRVSTAAAVEQWEKAVVVLNGEGSFGRSAKLLKAAAEQLEQEGDDAKCADMYSRAAELFDMDDYGKSSLTACMLKVAHYKAKAGDLHGSAQLFEKEGEKALQNTLLQYGAKDHFFNAGILHLALGDSVTVEIAVDRYCASDPKFAASREGKLLSDLSAAFKGQDADGFVEKLAEFDEITPLDAWKIEFLNKAKGHLQGNAGDPLSTVGGGDDGGIDLT